MRHSHGKDVAPFLPISAYELNANFVRDWAKNIIGVCTNVHMNSMEKTYKEPPYIFYSCYGILLFGVKINMKSGGHSGDICF